MGSILSHDLCTAYLKDVQALTIEMPKWTLNLLIEQSDPLNNRVSDQCRVLGFSDFSNYDWNWIGSR